jgi:predicted MPP superfamily phosphohydrolase
LQIFRLLSLFFRNASKQKKYIFYAIFWTHTLILVGGFVGYRLMLLNDIPLSIKQILGFTAITLYFTKPFILSAYYLSRLVDFLRKKINVLRKKNTNIANNNSKEEKINRKEFLVKTALFTSTIPFGIMTYGMSMGAYDYRVYNQKIKIPNLPSKFKGIKIAQISDLHVGSFWDTLAPKRGIELLLQQKPDLIFVTGDLVNNQTSEIKPHFSWLKQIKADLGVLSILGNHDYGDYKSWRSNKEKQQNMLDLYEAQKQLGWKLLVDSTHYITIENEKIAILGVGNWGNKSYFPKYGRLEDTYQNTEKNITKLLLSHDPTHWDSQVIGYPDIAMMFAGHTHGMQVGIEIGNIKWSPASYIYKQWAGLYKNEQNQQLYVNRGFGFSNVFPARVGILPEITIFELS